MRNVRPAGRASPEVSGELALFSPDFLWWTNAPSKAEVQQARAGEPGPKRPEISEDLGSYSEYGAANYSRL